MPASTSSARSSPLAVRQRRAIFGPLLVVLVSAPAHADPKHTLRLATQAPEGTAWAREFKAMASEVETNSNGSLRLKWFLGGIAGDEDASIARIRRGQLDGGAMSAACTRVAPSMRVTRLPGLFQTRAEVHYVLGQLRSIFVSESSSNGMMNLGQSVLGPDVIFARIPVRTLADLRALKVWRWSIDEIAIRTTAAMSIPPITLPVDAAGKAYEAREIDAFLAVPVAALAFQWSIRAKYITDLRFDYLTGCLFVTNQAFDQLTFEERQILTTAVAKAEARLEIVSAEQDRALLQGLFRKQGLEPVVVPSEFQAEFLVAARAARERVARELGLEPLLDKVQGILADYRLEHTSPARH